MTSGRAPIPDEDLTIVPANEASWDDLVVGARQVFEDAGFEEVTRPTLRRVVMRIDLA